MRFLISVIDNQSNSGSEDEMQAIDAFNDKLQANGHWIFACGLSDPKTATLIDNRNGAGLIREGSLFDSIEHYSGLWLIEAADRETAKALAKEGSKACNRKVELRSLL